MERLTNRNQFGEVEIKYKDENDFYDKAMEMANRLAELEDKLESGKLIELPCKAGDIIYVPYIYNGVSGIMRLPVKEIKIAKHSIVLVTDFETDDEIFAIKFSNGIFLLVTYNDIWFTDRVKAEAELARLQSK